MEKVRDGVLGRVGEMHPREIATVVNGFGRAARGGGWKEEKEEEEEEEEERFHPGVAVLDALAEASGPQLHVGFNAHGLASLINGFAHLDYRPSEKWTQVTHPPTHPPTPFSSSSSYPPTHPPTHPPTCLPLSLYPPTHPPTHPSTHPQAFVAALQQAIPRLNTQDYGIIMNGLSSLSFCPETYKSGILERLRDAAAPKLERFNDQEVGR